MQTLKHESIYFGVAANILELLYVRFGKRQRFYIFRHENRQVYQQWIIF